MPVTPYLIASRASTWNRICIIWELWHIQYWSWVFSGGNFHSSMDEKEAFYLHQSQAHQWDQLVTALQVAVIVSCEIWPSLSFIGLRIEDISSDILDWEGGSWFSGGGGTIWSIQYSVFEWVLFFLYEVEDWLVYSVWGLWWIILRWAHEVEMTGFKFLNLGSRQTTVCQVTYHSPKNMSQHKPDIPTVAFVCLKMAGLSA